MTTPARFYSCDDHLDIWVLPRDLWEGRLPAVLTDCAPRVGEQDGIPLWRCDGAILGPSGAKLLGDYNAISRAGIEDDGFRAAHDPDRLCVLPVLPAHDPTAP